MNDILCLIVLVTPSNTDVDWNMLQQIFGLVHTALPVKVQVHLINFPRAEQVDLAAGVLAAGETIFRELFASTDAETRINSSSSNSNQQDQRDIKMPLVECHVLNATSRKLVRDFVMSLHLTEATFPMSMGGEWKDQDEFELWCRTRQTIEVQQGKEQEVSQQNVAAHPSAQQPQRPQEEQLRPLSVGGSYPHRPNISSRAENLDPKMSYSSERHGNTQRVSFSTIPNRVPKSGTIGAFATPPSFSLSSSSEPPNDICSQFPDLVRSMVMEIVQSSPLSCEEENEALKVALATNSDVVMTETDPLQFVRYCNYDLKAAAKRLCLYWTQRKSVFGPDRAFLPLTLTGNGALNPQDVKTLEAGFPALLPDATTGQKCILVDRRKWIPTSTTEHKLRAYFYVAKLLAQDYHSQLYGAIFCSVKVTPRNQNVDWDCMRRITGIAASVMPIRHVFHLLCVPQKRKQSDGAELVHSLVQTMGKIFQTRVYTHIETEADQILNKLLAIGMTKKAVPLSFGGEWRVEDWFEWCQRRREREFQTYKHLLLKKVEDGNLTTPIQVTNSVPVQQTPESKDQDGPTDTKNPAAITVAETTVASKAATTEGTEKEKEDIRVAKRRMADLLYSRRKRERQRVQMQTLQDDSANLRRENQRLQEEQGRLQGLVDQATHIVAQLGGE